MASPNKVIKGLQILIPYVPYNGNNPNDIGADHDIIYGPSVNPNRISENDKETLEELGWFWYNGVTWAIYT